MKKQFASPEILLLPILSSDILTLSNDDSTYDHIDDMTVNFSDIFGA